MSVKVGVISGKGGTGKTTVAYSLAASLTEIGFRVGLLDVDLTGPNLTDILEKRALDVEDDRFIPASAEGLRYISLGQIASEGDPVLWSGEDLASAAKQLLERTEWGDLEYLVADFPPGSGGEAQALLPLMDFALIVTVPSALAESNVRRIIEMCRETGTPILGLVKNMAGFVCSSCGARYDIFPEDHGFEDIGIPTIAEIPLDPEVAKTKRINHFPVDAVLGAMEKPVCLKRRKKSLKRIILERLFTRG